MERRSFIRRGAAIALGAGLASGIASGVADLATPAARSRPAAKEPALTVVEGRVRETQRLGGLDRRAVRELRIILEPETEDRDGEAEGTDDAGEETTVRFYDADLDAYPGPRFDLDVLERHLAPGRRVRLVVWRRDGVPGYDGLKIVAVER